MHATLVHRPVDARIERRQCTTLAGAGYEVHLLVGGPGDRSVDGFELHSICDRFERPRLRRQPRRFARLARRALALRADLYHLHDPHLIPLGLLLQARGARVIYDVHEDYPAHAQTKLNRNPLRARSKAALWRLLEAIARRRFDGFVCASELISRKFPGERTTVVRNFPCLDEVTAPRVPGSRSMVALFLGTIRADRIEVCVRAFAHVPEASGLRLRMVGPAEPELVDEIRALPWGRRIEIEPVPALTRERILEEVSRATIGLATLSPGPNHREGWRSNKVFQLMAAQVPVIVNDFPEWRVIVERYRCGVAAGPDERDLARALTELAADPGRREELGRNGQAAVLRELNWEAESRGMLDLYERLVGVPEKPIEPSLEIEPPVPSLEPAVDRAPA